LSVSESRSKKAPASNEADTGPPTGLRAVLRYDGKEHGVRHDAP